MLEHFLSDKTFNFRAIKLRMASLWKPGNGLSVKDLNNGRFLFQFFDERDMKKVFEGGPWSFDGCILVLHLLQKDEIPMQVPLFYIPLWVQIF